MPVKDAETIPEGHVRVRVMKRGHDLIYTGEEIVETKGEHFPRYQKDDTFVLPKETADKYEDDGWVEILNA